MYALIRTFSPVDQWGPRSLNPGITPFCNRNVTQYFSVLFRLVKSGFWLISELILQVGVLVFARSNGHIFFKHCSKLFHRSKSSTGMISTCLSMRALGWPCTARACNSARCSSLSMNLAICPDAQLRPRPMKNEAGAGSRVSGFYPACD